MGLPPPPSQAGRWGLGDHCPSWGTEVSMEKPGHHRRYLGTAHAEAAAAAGTVMRRRRPGGKEQELGVVERGPIGVLEVAPRDIAGGQVQDRHPQRPDCGPYRVGLRRQGSAVQIGRRHATQSNESGPTTISNTIKPISQINKLHWQS